MGKTGKTLSETAQAVCGLTFWTRNILYWFSWTVELSWHTPVNTVFLSLSFKDVFNISSIFLTTLISSGFLRQQKYWDKSLVSVTYRCRGAVSSPREQQIDIHITWIMQIRREIAARGQSTNPVTIKDEIKQHEVSVLVRFVIAFLTR